MAHGDGIEGSGEYGDVSHGLAKIVIVVLPYSFFKNSCSAKTSCGLCSMMSHPLGARRGYSRP